MILNGGFTYQDVNQRELLFGVKVAEVHGSSDVFVGKSSEYSIFFLLLKLVLPHTSFYRILCKLSLLLYFKLEIS